MITEDQRAQFRQQGYLLVPNALQKIGLQRVQHAFERARQKILM